MSKKTLIIGIILASLLFTSTLLVHAADEEKSFTDPPDDVLDINDNPTNTKPNIDIVQIDYVKEGKKINLILTVKGNIENRGDINDTDSENCVYYSLYLSTTEHDYIIVYINKTCELKIDFYYPGNVDAVVSGSKITFTFDFNSSSEKYAGVYALTADSVSSIEYYTDDFYDMPGELDVTINAPNTGKVGQSITFSATVSGGTSYEYEWDFGDGGTSTEQNPTHIYTSAGTYDVTLVVSDQDGNQGYDSLSITISEDKNNNGGNTNGNNKEDSNSAILLFAAVIVIIVIIGVAIIVFIIRR
ncbi:MAG: PKD domain-containing protein [Candidatus Thermoplasmatota archaeon]|jgi:hypothetical protein|nr:PKD domain-containing protein [Candidatus Thermoplasmatota archaeon]